MLESWILSIVGWFALNAGQMLPAELAPEADPRYRPAVRASSCGPSYVAPEGF